MKNHKGIAFGFGVIAFLALVTRTMKGYLFPPIAPPRVRSDSWGDGLFGSSRNGHIHQGVDLIAAPGATVRAPLEGVVSKLGFPYAGDTRYRYVELTAANGDRVRVMYVEPSKLLTVGHPVHRGDAIGIAQNVAAKYGEGMVNHVHLELRRGGVNVDPLRFLPAVT